MQMRPQQYYPTYRFKDRDIVLLEFEDAQRIASSQTILYSQLTSVLFGFVTALIAFLGLKEDAVIEVDSLQFQNLLVYMSLIYFFTSYFVLNYFVDLQKTIAINARKVVTLRTMLGLDYGSLQMTLPSSRIEGAVNPFALPVFPGWLGTASFPLWIIILSSNAFWFYAITTSSLFEHPVFRWWHISVLFTLSYALLYRRRLFDEHETFLFSFVKFLSRLLRVSLTGNSEYTLFRSKLAMYEVQRLGINTKSLETILVAVEDNEFWIHNGVSVKALGRAFLANFRLFREKYKLLRSGGSTITMQLSRSLIIHDYHKTVRRKILEVFLAIWMESKFTKQEILQMYLASVRFDVNAIGLTDATKHFFGVTKREFTDEEAFFMVERLSNLKSVYRPNRVKALTRRIRVKNEIDIDERALSTIYSKMIDYGKLTAE